VKLDGLLRCRQAPDCPKVRGNRVRAAVPPPLLGSPKPDRGTFLFRQMKQEKRAVERIGESYRLKPDFLEQVF
jgi:hypothetical protein